MAQTLTICLLAGLALVGAVFGATSPPSTSSPPVDIRLRAPWQNPPLLLEILEAANTEDPASFWPLLSHFVADDAEALRDAHTPRDIYDVAKRTLDAAGLLQDAGTRSNWEMALALHSEAPKVAAFWQSARALGVERRAASAAIDAADDAQDCQSWVDWYGDIVCSAEDLQRRLSTGQTHADVKVPTYPFDHKLETANAQDTSPTAVLYARPLSSNFPSLHETLLSHLNVSKSSSPSPSSSSSSSPPPFRYILRWAPDSSAAAQTSGYLAGYGAALDLKKVDYLVIDDRKLANASDAPAIDEGSQGNAERGQQLLDRQWLDGELLKGNSKVSTRSSPSSPDAALSAEELETLDLKASHAIMQSADPVRAFAQLTQDFPLHASNLARGFTAPPRAFVDEIRFMQTRKVRPGSQEIWLNGRPLSEQDIVPLSLLKSLRTERALVDSLTAGPLRLTPGQAVDLLADGAVSKAQAPESEGVSIFDASDRIEVRDQRGEDEDDDADDNSTQATLGAITWFNDIEKDAAYHGMPTSLKALLRSTYPGQLPQIRRNLFNIVLVLDLSSQASCAFLADELWPLIGRVPLRWGLVPANVERREDGDSVQIARLFWHLLDNAGLPTAVEFLSDLSNLKTSDGKVPATSAKARFDKFTQRLGGNVSGDDVAAALHFESPREQSVRAYTQRLRLTFDDADEEGHFFLNGQYYPFSPRRLFQLVTQLVSVQTQQLARPIYFGQITDDDDVSTYFYDLPSTFASRSELVFPRLDARGEVLGPKARAVDLAKAFQAVGGGDQPTALTQFLYPDETASVNATMWVVADFDTTQGMLLVRQALVALQATPFRLGFVHSGGDGTRAAPPRLSSFLAQLIASRQLGNITPQHLIEVLSETDVAAMRASRGKVVDTGRINDNEDATASAAAGQQVVPTTYALPSYVDGAKTRGWTLHSDAAAGELWQSSQRFIEHLGVKAGEAALLVNGRLLSGVSPCKTTLDDLTTLLKNERQRRIDPVVAAIDRLQDTSRFRDLTREDAATAIAVVSSALSVNYFKDETQEGMFAPPVAQRTSIYDRLGVHGNRFEVGNRTSAKLRFQAIVDPLSETAQKWSALFKLVTGLQDVHLSVVLNPQANVTEMPLKRFYRYNAPSRLAFDTASGKEAPPTLSFLDMPQDAVLTMGLDAPPAWLTQTSEAVYDLDNIRLRDVPADGRSKGVVAVYDLKQILIEGHAREGRNEIPRGLQLVLETPDGSETLDTIVMANLAYFQFRARPGLYRLRIRQGGKSDELYEMKSVGNLGWDSPSVDVTGSDITLASLDGLTIYPRVEKRAGKEDEELLEDLEGDAMLRGDEDNDGGAGNAVKSFFGNLAGKASKAVSSKSPPAARPADQADINIFTVASGHLYERMTYIMILSVLKHTKSSVKFWFIENFLSPSFKELIPHFAREYGFQYEMVTYAWPHWLRAQTEKQRTIWGYKILFLDVLFPLDVDKVIFVDSDQVVRTDLKELTEIDLHGAPYGFPPMGDDSYDMDGYRFWKRGYWKDFLRGRPYHISALYVVDLQRFRSVAAGDKLRGQYQALSQDPGSLANLDQDLPQTLMFHLPIHTLEKEWLWCETWCSYDWLDRAKTIDLCSNPKTHEAKLDRARRQIPEWTVYDEEVQAFARRVLGGELEPEPKGEGEGEAAGKGESGGVVAEPHVDADAEHADHHPHDEL